MIIGFTGPLGSGKTLGLSVFGWYYSAKAGGAPLFANYHLDSKYFTKHRKLNPNFHLGMVTKDHDLLEMARGGGGILLLDELHRMLDSRLSVASVNIYLSQFFMYLRKLGISCFIASQHELNFDRRVRNVMDLMVVARKHPDGFSYELWDHQARMRMGRWFLPTPQAERFRGMYDTYELIKGFTFPGTQKAFDKFLEELDQARPHKRGFAEAPDFGAEVDALLEGVAHGGQ